jgi:hypothetical protein
VKKKSYPIIKQRENVEKKTNNKERKHGRQQNNGGLISKEKSKSRSMDYNKRKHGETYSTLRIHIPTNEERTTKFKSTTG